MAAPIDFYFDFSSPYGYFASTRIDALGAKYGREVVWRPVPARRRDENQPAERRCRACR